MKLKGKKTAGGRHKDVIAFPRKAGPIGFFVQAIDDEWDIFNERCPRPKPPIVTIAGGEQEENEEDEGYKSQVDNWSIQKTDFLVVHSLNVPENELEWDNVVLDKPSSWRHWRTEVKEFGLTRTEQNALLMKVIDINGLCEGLLDQARADFLRGPQKA